jgi:cytochrome c
VSKNPTSCFKTASKYFFLNVLTCLSPVYIQHAISGKTKKPHSYVTLTAQYFTMKLRGGKLHKMGQRINVIRRVRINVRRRVHEHE